MVPIAEAERRVVKASGMVSLRNRRRVSQTNIRTILNIKLFFRPISVIDVETKAPVLVQEGFDCVGYIARIMTHYELRDTAFGLFIIFMFFMVLVQLF